MTKKQMLILFIGVVIVAGFLVYANLTFDAYMLRVLNLIAIYMSAALGLCLINGFTGQFSLGIAGFMAVGAYAASLVTLPIAAKETIFFITPLIWPFNSLELPFVAGIIFAAIVTAIFSFLIGFPVLRLRGDYLAIATLGFSEIIRVVSTNTVSITNGALGLRSIPPYTNIWWSFGFAAFALFVIWRLINSSYGRAFKAIRDNDVAAEAMGIGLFKHKLLAFVVGSTLAGVSGAFLAHLLTAIDPAMFRFFLTFNVLLMIVLGGMSSITGAVLGASIVTFLFEFLRYLDSPMDLGFITIPGAPGLRMVIFSTLLIVMILFRRQGLMGSKELTFEWIEKQLARFGGKKGKPREGDNHANP